MLHSAYKEKLVFVALANGKLAIFSRMRTGNDEEVDDNDDDDHDDDDVGDVDEERNESEAANKDNKQQQQQALAAAAGEWSLSSPRLVSVAEFEHNASGKLCVVDDDFLWFSYGRNIFILRISTLKLESTIMAPTNDLALQFSMQSISIEQMSLMEKLRCVWISFRNSHLIQMYDVSGGGHEHKLLAELSLSEQVNKMLANGNEIIRQHKMAQLKPTVLLSHESTTTNLSTLFVGTSAGLILYLSISRHQQQQQLDSLQLQSLSHGHSGQVKLLHLLELQDIDNNQQQSEPSELFLVSAGSGSDFYGPTTTVRPQQSFEHQQQQQQTASDLATNSEHDNLNHLIIWQL